MRFYEIYFSIEKTMTHFHTFNGPYIKNSPFLKYGSIGNFVQHEISILTVYNM